MATLLDGLQVRSFPASHEHRSLTPPLSVFTSPPITPQTGEVLLEKYKVSKAQGRGVFSSVLRAVDITQQDGPPVEVCIKVSAPARTPEPVHMPLELVNMPPSGRECTASTLRACHMTLPSTPSRRRKPCFCLETYQRAAPTRCGRRIVAFPTCEPEVPVAVWLGRVRCRHQLPGPERPAVPRRSSGTTR